MPGKCASCGYGSADRKYLDTRFDAEFYGAVIFCEICVGSMANDFGFLQPEQSKNLIARLEASEHELVTLRSAIIALEEFRDAFDRLGLTGNLSVPPTVADLHEPETHGISEGTDQPEGSDDQGSDEQTDESGPDDLSDPLADFDGALKL